LNTITSQSPSKILELFLLLILASFTISVVTLSDWINSLLMVILALSVLLSFKVKPCETPDTVKKYYAISALLFLGLFFSSLTYQPLAFFENRFEPFRYLVLWWFLYYFFLSRLVNEQLLFKAIVLSGLVLLGWVVMVVIEEPNRGQGLLSTPIQRGNLGMMVGLMSLVAVFYFQGVWRWLAALAVVAGVVLSILSGSRGGWMAFFVSAITILLVQKRYNFRDFKFGLLIVFIMAVGLALFIDSTPIPQRFDQTLQSLVNYITGENLNTSLGRRIEMWKVALMAFWEKPFLGWGFDSYQAVYNQYYLSQEAIKPAKGSGWGQPHNDYLLFLVETGAVGFSLLMVFLLYPLKVYIQALLIGLKQHHHQLVFVSLLGIVMLECLLEFMLSDRNLIFRHTLYFFVTVNVMCLMFIGRLKANQDVGVKP